MTTIEPPESKAQPGHCEPHAAIDPALQRLRLAVASTADALALFDEAGEAEFVNASALRLFDCNDLAEFAVKWKRAARDPDGAAATGPFRSSWMNVSVSGGRRRIDVTTHTAEGVGGTVVVMRDASAIESLRDDLQLAAQSRALATIYKVLLHDAKAPLNAIVLNMDMLRETLEHPTDEGENLQERQLRYIETVRREIGRVNRSLKGVLSRAGSTSGAMRQFDLRRVVREITALVRPMARDQHVRVKLKLPSEPARLFGPRDRVKQALINVVINAIEAMPSGGYLSMQMEVHDRIAHLDIEDTGRGIPEALLERVFEMHFTTKKHGSGIGLYVARAVISSQGGSIDLDSALGEGTTARVRLDLHADEPTG